MRHTGRANGIRRSLPIGAIRLYLQRTACVMRKKKQTDTIASGAEEPAAQSKHHGCRKMSPPKSNRDQTLGPRAGLYKARP